ncbi:darcynin family protein [Methylobacterium sp. ARG-1]|uniref:darcynin family protein n=1 Tax=Methylobacterium sp. ARG-1 TaxID=1692501 RepID=UPI00068135DC|nr:darcynin family protein [Methylobacterium sp. ARG-1]KNY21445.1 darcynin [Methylobacterium sp. ARG-1]
MSDQTFNSKLTVFMLVKTSPEWLALSIDERFARLREVFEPILRRHADSVKLRFYDAEFYTTRITDLWVWEASDHHAYECVVEALRETAFWDRWFAIVEIIPAVENAYATHYGRAPLAA